MKIAYDALCFLPSPDVEPPLTLTFSPDTSTAILAGSSVAFTCVVNANPPPQYSLWVNYSMEESLEILDLNTNSGVLEMTKEYNHRELFCRAEGDLDAYPLISASQAFSVLCKSSTLCYHLLFHWLCLCFMFDHHQEHRPNISHKSNLLIRFKSAHA